MMKKLFLNKYAEERCLLNSGRKQVFAEATTAHSKVLIVVARP